ncbi:MAG TPA: PEP-utilizing enzyme [Gaiellaceae bacterium]|nr:PEP-utilizing enzyme [Gaiellaceae bacterium]
MSVVTENAFAPPRPGVWFLDLTHFTRPVTRFHAELFPEQMIAGFSESLRRYGSLLAYLDLAFINGFFYYCPRPVGAPEDVGHPPREVWDELAQNHPDIRERLRTSASALERRLWREDLERWDSEVKPAAIRAHLELLAVEPAALSTDDLLAYLERCRENQKRGAYLHHLFNMPALVPVGDFLAQAREWTGRPGAELLGLLQGANPDPLGADAELARLVAAVQEDPAASSVLDSAGEPGEVLAGLRSLRGETGPAAAAYIDRVGYRPVNGEDVGEPCVLELPELIVGAIRSALEVAERVPPEDLVVERAAEVRESVPAGRRDAFDQLLDEAKLTYRLRDERGTYADLWAIGIMRRAILAAGERLAAQGVIEEPSHLVEADYRELQALVRSGTGVGGEELAERARYRLEARYSDAPPVLGGEPGAPLPLEWLPLSAARLERALGAAVHELFVAPPPRTEARKVRGLGASPGTYEGTAKVIRGTSEFGRIDPGDILVTNSTTTAFNIVLPLLGAIVTDRGGLLSHAAIVAREFGIPGVVGCTDATAVLPDGARVRVDGSAGEVEVVS